MLFYADYKVRRRCRSTKAGHKGVHTGRIAAGRKSTGRIILHHADAKNCSAEDIHRWHLNNGWSGAGYHFLVRKDGKVYRLRPEDKVGAHAYGANYNSLGICFEGNYMEEDMPEAQKEAGKELGTGRLYS